VARLCGWRFGGVGLSVEIVGRRIGRIDVEPTRVYHFEDARQFLAAEGDDADAIAPQADGKLIRAFVRDKKAHSTVLRPHLAPAVFLIMKSAALSAARTLNLLKISRPGSVAQALATLHW